MLEGGTSREAEARRTGQVTSGYMPGARRPSALRTSSSTGMVRVLGSMECAILRHHPAERHARKGRHRERHARSLHECRPPRLRAPPPPGAGWWSAPGAAAAPGRGTHQRARMHVPRGNRRRRMARSLSRSPPVRAESGPAASAARLGASRAAMAARATSTACCASTTSFSATAPGVAEAASVVRRCSRPPPAWPAPRRAATRPPAPWLRRRRAGPSIPALRAAPATGPALTALPRSTSTRSTNPLTRACRSTFRKGAELAGQAAACAPRISRRPATTSTACCAGKRAGHADERSRALRTFIVPAFRIIGIQRPRDDRERPSRIAYTEGKAVRVATVARIRPPITARPRGAAAWPPSPKPIAMGSMPAIIAPAVIRMARTRPCAPCKVASCTVLPSRRLASAKVTSRIALATEMPMAMMAPMKDWMFRVVCVTSSISSTPQTTAGHRREHRDRETEGLEVRRQQQEDHHDGEQQAGAQPREGLLQRRNLPADEDRHP